MSDEISETTRQLMLLKFGVDVDKLPNPCAGADLWKAMFGYELPRRSMSSGSDPQRPSPGPEAS